MNKKEGLLCADISRAAYINRYDGDDFYITAKFENKGTDTQGIFGVAYDNTFVVGFRGSEETGIADWITDINFLKDVISFIDGIGSSVKAHRGFLGAYKSVRDAIINGVKDTSHKRIICTGHSLGAGLATLCALDIRYNIPDKSVYCYTYGSPRVGNTDFAALYDKKVPNTFRFVNGTDVVPSAPRVGYKHVGNLHKIGQENDDEFSLSEIIENLTDKLEDHFPHNYINMLRKWL